MAHRLVRAVAPLAFVVLVVLVVLVAPPAAHAGNDDEFLVGNRAAMVGGAVVAVVDDPSASWYNPAGLGAVQRDQLDITGTAYTLRLYAVPKLISTIGGKSVDASVVEFLTVPTQAAYVRRLKPNMVLGFGYFQPKASNVLLRENLDDRTGNPSSTWQVALSGAEYQHIFAAALGLGISDKLRLGLSLLGGYSTFSGASAWLGAVFEAGSARSSSATSRLVTQSAITAQLAVGMQLDVTPNLVLGLSVRSPAIRFYESFDAFDTSSTTTLANSDNPLQPSATEIKKTDTFGMPLTGRFGLAIAYRYTLGFISAEADVQPGAHGSGLYYEARRPVVNARAGWYHRVGSAIALGVGLFTDRTSDSPSEAFGAGGVNFYGGTLGLELNTSHLLAPNEGTGSLVFTNVFAFRYAFGAGDFNTLVGQQDDAGTVLLTTTPGRSYIHEFSLYVGGGVKL